MIAPLVGGLTEARALSHEALQHWLELADHRQTMEQLGSQLSSMLSSPPPEGNDDKSAEARAEYGLDLVQVQCSLIREDRCFFLPLDHEYGEQFDPPGAEHWWDAPGVHGGQDG